MKTFMIIMAVVFHPEDVTHEHVLARGLDMIECAHVLARIEESTASTRNDNLGFRCEPENKGSKVITFPIPEGPVV